MAKVVKKVVEKATGEKYASKAAMKKHEGKEGKKEQFMEMIKAKQAKSKKK